MTPRTMYPLPVMMVIGTFFVDGVALIDVSPVASTKSGGDSSWLSLMADKTVLRAVFEGTMLCTREENDRE